MKTIKLNDVKIRKDFSNSVPNKEKITKAVELIKRYGRIDKPLILNHGVLEDNYTRYVAAKTVGLEEVSYIELHEVSYAVCKFDGNEKEYIWKNDKAFPINIGDKVFVNVNHNKNHKRVCVTVVDIFTSGSLELFNKHKSIVSRLAK